MLLAASIGFVHVMARGTLWSPYYKITVQQEGPDTVIEVNNLFHQSMARVEQKEYFYQWPYAVFGDTFDNVLVLGAGFGDRRRRRAPPRRDAMSTRSRSIPVILRLGREHHPDHPYSDPRVTVVNDDARHFLRTTTKKYDLVVFALIDSLTLQSSFSGVRLESYMFTLESFRGGERSPHGQRPARHLQLFSRALAGRSAREHGGDRVRPGAARARPRSACRISA